MDDSLAPHIEQRREGFRSQRDERECPRLPTRPERRSPPTRLSPVLRRSRAGSRETT